MKIATKHTRAYYGIDRDGNPYIDVDGKGGCAVLTCRAYSRVCFGRKVTGAKGTFRHHDGRVWTFDQFGDTHTMARVWEPQ